MSKINHLTFTLLEATITLYPAKADDSPELGAPVFAGVAVENFRAHERWLKAPTRPTGARFPRQHPLIPEYEISLDRPWVLPLAQLTGFRAAHTRYVLDVVWREEDGGQWHRRVFYGVTISEHAHEARGPDTGHDERQVFAAEYVTATASGAGAVPPIEPALPLIVRFVTESETVDLYHYDAANAAFNESSAGITTGRATLSYTPSDKSGTFDVKFAGEDFSALQLKADGRLEALAFIESVPTLADLPRVEFYYGATRVAAVSKSGRVFAPAFRELTILPPAAPVYKLYSASAFNAAIRPGSLDATGFHVFTPADLTGLKLWSEIENISPVFSPAEWPDMSAGNADLTAENDVHYGEAGELVTGASDSGPVLFLDKDTSSHLHTAAAVINPDNHVVFIVARPGQQDGVGGGSNMAILGTGGSGDNDGDFTLAQFGYVLLGRFWTDGGATANTATGGTTIGDQLIPFAPWGLCEQEVNGTALIVRLNGALEAQAVIGGVKSGISKPIYVGSETNGTTFLTFGGFLKAVVVVEGTLTAAEKAKLRGYLNNRYAIY